MVFPLIGLSRGFIRRRHFVCRRRQDRDKTDHPAISPLKRVALKRIQATRFKSLF